MCYDTHKYFIVKILVIKRYFNTNIYTAYITQVYKNPKLKMETTGVRNIYIYKTYIPQNYICQHKGLHVFLLCRDFQVDIVAAAHG